MVHGGHLHGYGDSMAYGIWHGEFIFEIYLKGGAGEEL
jgi:hypothetical protein